MDKEQELQEQYIDIFGKHIRALRINKAMSIEELAHLANLHTNTISAIERGEMDLKSFNVLKIAVALGYSGVNELFSAAKEQIVPELKELIKKQQK